MNVVQAKDGIPETVYGSLGDLEADEANDFSDHLPHPGVHIIMIKKKHEKKAKS